MGQVVHIHPLHRDHFASLLLVSNLSHLLIHLSVLYNILFPHLSGLEEVHKI